MLASACTNSEFRTQQAIKDINEGRKPQGLQDMPSCEVAFEEYQLDGNVLSFEIDGKNGIKLGFSLGKIFKYVGLGFKTEKGKMTMSMSLSESVQPTNHVAYVMGSAESSKKEFSFDLDIYGIGLGYDYFSQTPIAGLTAKTAQSALKNLEAELARNKVRWKSKVIHVDDGSVAIPVGTVSGLRPGDWFNVYNVEYLWRGKPCESELIMAKRTTVEPIAEVQAIQVEYNASLLRIENMNSEEKIKLGAVVEVMKLGGKDSKTRKLSIPVNIRSITSLPIVIHNDVPIDLSVFVGEQTRANMDAYHFTPKR